MRAALAFFVALAAALPASAADRTYSMTSFEKIRVDGPYDVKVSTGVSPFARASGDWAAIDQLVMNVEGHTLVIRPPAGSPSADRGGKLTIEVGTPGLTHAALNGAGRIRIDKVRGLAFDLAVVGAGTVDVAALDVEQLSVGLSGVAGSRLGGAAKSVKAVVRGSSRLDAGALETRDLRLGAEGSAVAHVKALTTANIQAMGPVTVVVEGGPACTVKAQGPADISGC